MRHCRIQIMNKTNEAGTQRLNPSQNPLLSLSSTNFVTHEDNECDILGDILSINTSQNRLSNTTTGDNQDIEKQSDEFVFFDNSRGSGPKNVIFSNGLNFMSECLKLLY